MANRYSSGKNTIAICDVCGQRYKLRQLKNVIVKTKNTNIKACPSCWDKDHPQLLLGMYPVEDPQAVRDPRPDHYLTDGSRVIQWGWNPIGLNDPFNLESNALTIQVELGTLTVTTT